MPRTERPASNTPLSGLTRLSPEEGAGAKKRLLVLSAAYPAPSEPERAVFVENLTRELMTAETPPLFDVTVVAPRVRRDDPRVEPRRGIDVRRFRYPSRGRRLKEIDRPGLLLLSSYFVSACCTALAVARAKRVDVILAHWILPMGLVGAIVAMCLRRPLVVVAHGSDVNRYASGRIGRWLCRWTLRRSRRVVAVSHDLRERMMRTLGVPKERLVHLPMGVDAGLFHLPPDDLVDLDNATAGGGDRERRDGNASSTAESRGASVRAVRSRLGVKLDGSMLLFVGDLTPAKGVPELVSAWRRLRKRRTDVSLCLVGEGPLREGLQAELAREIEDGDCRLPGRVPQSDLPLWYRSADVLVLPSHSEGAPVAVMEALACGLPVVATEVGGSGELVEDGVTGCLVPPRDIGCLTSTLDGLIADEERLRSFRRELRRRPAARSSRQQARHLRGVLQEVCDRTHPHNAR